MHNDIWSLGIILLNLTTGRNPWKSAASDDATYQAYSQDPDKFLMSVLPISEELNDILVQILEIDWTARISLIDLRAAVEGVSTFYADHVIFEGSLARCPWEAGVDLGNGTASNSLVKKRHERPVPPLPEGIEPYCVFSMSPTTSLESRASIMDISARPCWQGYSDPKTSNVRGVYDDEPGTPSSARSSCSSDLSVPATPFSVDQGNHDFARVKLDATYGRQRHCHAKIGSTSFQPSSWEEEENDEEHCFTQKCLLGRSIRWSTRGSEFPWIRNF